MATWRRYATIAPEGNNSNIGDGSYQQTTKTKGDDGSCQQTTNTKGGEQNHQEATAQHLQQETDDLILIRASPTQHCQEKEDNIESTTPQHNAISPANFGQLSSSRNRICK